MSGKRWVAGAPRRDDTGPRRLLVASANAQLHAAAQQAISALREGGHDVDLLILGNDQQLGADAADIAVVVVEGEDGPDLPSARVVRWDGPEAGLTSALDCALRDHAQILALAVANERLERLLAERTRELEEANLILERLETTDPLTGIVNRRRFIDLASREVLRCRRTGASVSVILLDIDHFHVVNDQYGQASGDAVLLEVVNRVGQGLRTLDVLGRLGGEEFGVLLPEAGLDGARVVAERLRESVAATPINAGGERLAITASLGVACLGVDETLDGLLHRADDALGAAKGGGRNRVETA